MLMPTSCSTTKTQKGMSLIELMVGIAISLILLAGILTVVLRMTVSGGESVQATRLNQQMRGSLDYITKDLQRAGYINWFSAWDACTDGTTNGVLDDINTDSVTDVQDFYQCVTPALDVVGEVSLWSFPSPGSPGTPSACTSNCDCVLYSYDLNEDGYQGIGTTGTPGANQNAANFELFGIRRNGTDIEVRTGGAPNSCNGGSWQAISDANLNVTTLTFAMAYATAVGAGNDSTMYQISGDGAWNSSYQNTCTPVNGGNAVREDSDVACLLRRKIDVAMTATLASNNAVTLSLQSDVKIKNDHLNTIP